MLAKYVWNLHIFFKRRYTTFLQMIEMIFELLYGDGNVFHPVPAHTHILPPGGTHAHAATWPAVSSADMKV